MAEPIRVLHVDDQPDFADLTATYLNRESDRFTVETATSVDEGLSRLADETFDCVISDYDMPKNDGIDFLNTVREEYPDLPFLLFTGKGSEEIASEAISAGVTDYIQKKSGTDQYTVLANRIINAVDQYRTETALQRSEERYRRLVEQAPIPIFIYAKDGTVIDLNSAAVEFLNADAKSDIIGTNLTSFAHSDTVADAKKRIQRMLTEGEPAPPAQHKVVALDGEIKHAIVASAPIQYDNETAIQTVAYDITERVEREQQLQEERDRFESLFETLPEPAVLINAETDGRATIKQINPAFTEVFGYEQQEAIGEDLDGLLVPKDQREAARKLGQRAIAGDLGPTEVTRQTKDGELRECLLFTTIFSDNSDGDVSGFVMYADVTELQTHARRLQALTDAFPDLAFIIDEEGRHVEQLSSPASENLLVDDPEAIIGSDFADLFSNDQADEFLSIVEQTITTSQQTQFEYQLDIAGQTRWFEARVTPYPGMIEQKDAVVWVSRDITDRKEREQELTRQRDRFNILFEALPEPTVLLTEDKEATIRAVNPAFEEIFGYDANAIRGENLNDLIVPPEKRDEAAQIDSRGYDGNIFTKEVQRQTADGELRDFLLVTTGQQPHSEAETTEAFAIYADITDLRESQRELQRQNERLSNFVSFVSHDLQSPLKVAEGHLELAQEESESTHIEKADRALDRMQTLIEDLLTLARHGEQATDIEPVALADVAQQSWQTVETHEATLVIDTDQTIYAEESRLRQLLENLLGNAVTHGGEDVTVTVGTIDEQGRDGFYVADDGPGIPVNDHETVFEQGYSTENDGTGFGLAIVKVIAEAHGWTINVTDSKDDGAKIEITDVTIEA